MYKIPFLLFSNILWYLSQKSENGREKIIGGVWNVVLHNFEVYRITNEEGLEKSVEKSGSDQMIDHTLGNAVVLRIF